MRGFFFAAVILLFSSGPGLAAVELIMFNSPACEYCDMWEEDVGIIYDKTDEAKIAPIRRIFIGDADKVKMEIRPVMYTPTFVLIDQNKEIGRIVGYGGEAFFWGFMEELLKKLPAPQKTSSRIPSLSVAKTASSITVE